MLNCNIILPYLKGFVKFVRNKQPATFNSNLPTKQLQIWGVLPYGKIVNYFQVCIPRCWVKLPKKDFTQQ